MFSLIEYTVMLVLVVLVTLASATQVVKPISNPLIKAAGVLSGSIQP